jgi:flagellar basal-body rod protein FlgG
MFPAYASAVSGVQASQQALNITANNIANVNTPGFDASDPTLEDLIYQQTDARNLVNGATTTTLGAGAHVENAPRSLQPGAPQETGNPLDVAITGDGYLPVLQTNGATGYTRLGAIRLDAQGRFTVNGLLLQPPITVPANATNPTIVGNGQVTAITPTGQQVIGQIQLARFINEQGLQAVGSTIFIPTAASGSPITGIPTQPGFGALQPGALEAARVDLAREMTSLIISERAFGLNSRALQAIDQIIGDVTKR